MANTETSSISQNLIEIKNENKNNRTLHIQLTDHFAPLKNAAFYEHLKDARIKGGGQIFRAHKVILANSIGYFDELFRSAQANEPEIEVDIDDPEIMNSFITFAYTGEIEVNENNVFRISKAATILKTNYIHKSCRLFLIELMQENFENNSMKNDYLDLDFEFWKTVILGVQVETSTQSIFNAVMRWINHNYDERNTHSMLNILNLVELSDLSSDYIDGYLFQDENSIGFKHKEIVYEVHSRRYQLVKQLNSTSHNDNVEPGTQSLSTTNNVNVEHLENRGANLENDVGYQSSGESSRDRVPFNTMTRIPEGIINSLQESTLSPADVVKCELMLSDDTRDDTITENSLDENSSENEADNSSAREQSTNESRNNSIQGTSLNNNSTNSLAEKAKEHSKKKIFVLSLEQSRVIEIYDPETNAWTSIQMAENENAPNWFSCTEYKGKLYKFGGIKATRKSETHFPNVAVFKPGKNTWKELESMIIKRREGGAASLKNHLYVCGGWTGKEITNTVERYSVRHKEWKQILPMKERRCAPAVVVFEDCIYAIGGVGRRTGLNDIYLDSVEVYDLKTKEWSILEERMKTKRSSCGAAVLNGKIYVCGGWNDTIALNVVEMFDPKLKTWTTVESMNKGRKQFLVVAYSGKLWAIGGARSETWIEVYDPIENRWSCKERKGVNQTNFYVTGSLL